MSGTKQRTIQKGKSTPIGYKPAYFKPTYAREWGSFGCPPIPAEVLQSMGAPTCIEKKTMTSSFSTSRSGTECLAL